MTRLPNQDTIPCRPPVDESVLHMMSLSDAMQAIEVFRERESAHLARITQLESRIADLTSEKR